MRVGVSVSACLWGCVYRYVFGSADCFGGWGGGEEDTVVASEGGLYLHACLAVCLASWMDGWVGGWRVGARCVV